MKGKVPSFEEMGTYVAQGNVASTKGVERHAKRVGNSIPVLLRGKTKGVLAGMWITSVGPGKEGCPGVGSGQDDRALNQTKKTCFFKPRRTA